MSDMQVLLRGGVTWFAKNSDREPSEPQHVVRIPAVENDRAAIVDCSLIQISQTARRHALILSKPSWTWGAEMGVSELGVAIGNAAVPSKFDDESDNGLLGADLVRLALERSYDAEEAIQIIADLLEQYGQGGASGYRDKSQRCDNVFLIADRSQAWLMETAGRFWAARCVGKHSELIGEGRFAAVSNCLTIEHEFDVCSDNLQDLARKHGYWDGEGEFSFRGAFEAEAQPFFAGAGERRRASEEQLAGMISGDEPELPQFYAGLRHHHSSKDPFHAHDNQDLCRHAAGKSCPAQTCGSMVARLVERNRDDYLFTGSSAPCLSFFKPVDFDFSIAYHFLHRLDDSEAFSYWHQSESLHRRALFNPDFREALRDSQREVEREMFCWLNEANPLEGASYREADQIAAQWHEAWHTRAQELPMDTDFLSRYGSFWKNLNRQDLII